VSTKKFRGFEGRDNSRELLKPRKLFLVVGYVPFSLLAKAMRVEYVSFLRSNLSRLRLKNGGLPIRSSSCDLLLLFDSSTSLNLILPAPPLLLRL